VPLREKARAPDRSQYSVLLSGKPSRKSRLRSSAKGAPGSHRRTRRARRTGSCSLDPRSRTSWRWPCWTGAVWRRGTPKPEEDQPFSRYPLHRLEDSSLNRPCFHITYTARSRQPFQVRLDHRITRSSLPPLSAY